MKKVFILMLFFLIFLTSCGKEKEVIEKKYYNTVIVQTGSVNNSDSFIGYTESFNSVNLSAKIGGRITTLNKKVGDKVKIGELIATLDSSEALSNLLSNEQIVLSLNELKKANSESFDSQILAMKEKVNSAKTEISIAEISINGSKSGVNDTKNTIEKQLQTINTQIAQAESALDTANTQYENTKNILYQKEQTIYTNGKSAISNANILASNTFDFLDNIFGITEKNKYKNIDYEKYLGAKSPESKTNFENDYKKYLSEFNNLKNLSINDNESIKIALEKYNSFFSGNFRNLLKSSYNVIENSISTDTLPDSTIQTYKLNITDFQSKNEQLILSVSGNYVLGLKGSIDNINNFQKEKISTLDLLQKQIVQSQKQIDTLKSTYNQYSSAGNGQLTDVNTKNELTIKQKEIANNSLNELHSQIEALKKQKEASLKQIDTQINEVKSGKNTSSVMLENGKIYSPINGIVTKKLGEIGQVVGVGTPIIEVATDTTIKILVGVQNEVKNNISIGSEVKVEIEGFQEQITGKITNILPTVDEITKKTNIEIKIENPENEIKIGSYAKVYFDLGNKNENGKIIPNNAILSNMLVSGVYVIESGKAIFKNIKILKQNDNFSMIEGLNIGDEIITDGKENISDGEVLK